MITMEQCTWIRRRTRFDKIDIPHIYDFVGPNLARVKTNKADVKSARKLF